MALTEIGKRCESCRTLPVQTAGPDAFQRERAWPRRIQLIVLFGTAHSDETMNSEGNTKSLSPLNKSMKQIHILYDAR